MLIFKFDKIQSTELFPLMKSTANEHYVLTLPYISNLEGKSKVVIFSFFSFSFFLSVSLLFFIFTELKKS